MRVHRHCRIRLVVLLVSWAALAVPLVAQAGPLTLQASVRTVVVDVVVTDREGHPVQGLRQGDFLAFEDRQAQVVTNFEEHTVVPPVEAKLPALPPNVFLNVPRIPLSDSVTLLLLDSLNTQLQDQQLVHRQMLKFLLGAPPGRRMAIVTLGSQLRMIQGFTADPAILWSALADARRGGAATAPPVLNSPTDTVAAQAGVAAVAGTFAGQVAPSTAGSPRVSDGGTTAVASLSSFLAEQTAAQQDQRVRMTIEAFQQLARYLAGIPGRKNLVWFSSAFPLTLFPDSGNDLGGDRGNEEMIRTTDALLASAQVAIYPIAAEGLLPQSLFDAGHRPVGVQNASSAQNEQNQSLRADFTDRVGARTAMEMIAKSTGGKAFYDTNDLSGALTEASEDGSHFYTLAYTPAGRAMDGRYRRIEIKLDGAAAKKGYRLAYRAGYYASAPKPPVEASEPAADPLRRFMGFGMPDSTQLRLGLRVVPGKVGEAAGPVAGENAAIVRPLTRYSVEFVVAASGMKLTEAPDGRHSGKLEATLLLYDGEGKALNWRVRSFNLTMDAAEYARFQATGFNFRMDIDGPPSAAVLRTGVYDWQSNLSGTLEISLKSLVR